MNQVKLVYFEGCPEAKNVRAALLTAGIYDFEVIIQNKIPQDDEYKNFTSPSVLNGDELVYGTKINVDMGACTYNSGDLNKCIQKIKTSVTASSVHIGKKGLRSFSGPILTAILALKCPACIPALTAGLSAIGLGFFISQAVIKSVFIFFLLITIASLFFSYKKKHENLIPIIGAVIFSLILYIGRFHFINQFMLYGGMAGLFAMVVLDLILKAKSPCPACH